MKWLRLILWAFPIILWLSLVYAAWSTLERPEFAKSSRFQYGQKELAPQWMPNAWLGAFLKEINLEASESVFARQLPEVSSTLSSSAWVRKVTYIRRSYDGDMKFSLEIRRPLCLLQRGTKQTYLDEDLRELVLLNSQKPEVLVGEILPIVNVEAILDVPLKKKDKWLGETIDFIKQWNRREALMGRLALSGIQLEPYRGGAECFIKARVKDLRFNGEVLLDWGVNRDNNELEDRKSEEKWKDLEKALAQDRAFSSLDLRYKKPDLRF